MKSPIPEAYCAEGDDVAFETSELLISKINSSIIPWTG